MSRKVTPGPVLPPYCLGLTSEVVFPCTARQNGSYGLRSRVFRSRIVTPTTKSHVLEIMNVSAATIATAAMYSPAMRSATSNAAPTSWVR